MGLFSSESNSSESEKYPDSDSYSNCPYCGAPKSTTIRPGGTHVGFFESRPSFPSEYYVVEKVKCHEEGGVRPPEYSNDKRCGRPFYMVTKFQYKHADG